MIRRKVVGASANVICNMFPFKIIVFGNKYYATLLGDSNKFIDGLLGMAFVAHVGRHTIHEGKLFGSIRNAR